MCKYVLNMNSKSILFKENGILLQFLHEIGLHSEQESVASVYKVEYNHPSLFRV